MQTTNWYAYLLGEARMYRDPNIRKQFMYSLPIGLGISVIAGSILSLIYHDIFRLVMCIFTCLPGTQAQPLINLLQSPYYIVGHKGVIYVSRQYTLYTPWENIARVEEQHGKTPPSIWLKELPAALTLEEAVAYRKQSAIVNGISPIKITDPKDTRMQIALPSSPFWQKTALGQDILRHVPYLT